MAQAIGSSRDPILFAAIRRRLRNALFELARIVTTSLRHSIRDIVREIGNNIEMLRGSEARILATNGDFLERLGTIMDDIRGEMDIIGDTAASVRNAAEQQRRV